LGVKFKIRNGEIRSGPQNSNFTNFKKLNETELKNVDVGTGMYPQTFPQIVMQSVLFNTHPVGSKTFNRTHRRKCRAFKHYLDRIIFEKPWGQYNEFRSHTIFKPEEPSYLELLNKGIDPWAFVNDIVKLGFKTEDYKCLREDVTPDRDNKIYGKIKCDQLLGIKLMHTRKNRNRSFDALITTCSKGFTRQELIKHLSEHGANETHKIAKLRIDLIRSLMKRRSEIVEIKRKQNIFLKEHKAGKVFEESLLDLKLHSENKNLGVYTQIGIHNEPIYVKIPKKTMDDLKKERENAKQTTLQINEMMGINFEQDFKTQRSLDKGKEKTEHEKEERKIEKDNGKMTKESVTKVKKPSVFVVSKKSSAKNP